MPLSRRVWLVVAPSLLACGPSQSDYAQLQQERDALSTRVDSLALELDELRNGAARRLGLAQAAVERGDYVTAVREGNSLRETHPGSNEAKEAAAIVAQAERELAAARARAAADSARAVEAASRSERDRVRSVLRVSRLSVDDPNSAGGVDVRVRFQNRSEKTIKYARFSVTPYNAVGDVVSCRIRGYSNATLSVTRPVRPGVWYGDDTVWETVWYNSTIVRGQLTSVEIEYMDGSTATLSGTEIEHIRY
jgi:hypothetical protein